MTEYSLGKREQTAWVEEDGGYATLTSNTMADDGEVVGYDVQVTPEFSQNWQERLSAGADSREIEAMDEGPRSYKFKLKFIPYNWKFIKYCSHTSVTNTDQSTYYQHDFTLGNEVKSFRLEWARRMSTNQVFTLSGCVIKRFTLRFNKGTGPKDSYIYVDADCVAQSLSVGTSVTSLSKPTATPFRFQDITYTYAGSTITEVNSGEIVIENGINEDDSRYANATLGRDIGEPIPTIAKYNFVANVNQKDDTVSSDWRDATAVGSTNTLVIQRGTNDNITFTLSELYLDGANGPTNLEGVNTFDIVGRPMSLAITAKDDDSTY